MSWGRLGLPHQVQEHHQVQALQPHPMRMTASYSSTCVTCLIPCDRMSVRLSHVQLAAGTDRGVLFLTDRDMGINQHALLHGMTPA
jgi:hypothetical protein